MEFGVDTKTALGLVARHLVTATGTALASYGILAKDGSQTEAFVGAVMFLLAMGWSYWQKRNATLVTSVAAKAGPIVSSDTSPVKAAQAAEALAQRKEVK